MEIGMKKYLIVYRLANEPRILSDCGATEVENLLDGWHEITKNDPQFYMERLNRLEQIEYFPEYSFYLVETSHPEITQKWMLL